MIFKVLKTETILAPNNQNRGGNKTATKGSCSGTNSLVAKCESSTVMKERTR